MKHRNNESVKNFFVALLSIIALVSLGTNVFFYQKLQSQNIVAEVSDGDTFQLASGKRVRLMGVDAPEFDRCGGKQAKEKLSELINGKYVQLKEEVEESFGRSLALVYVGDTLVNEVILSQGWGRTDYRKNSQRDVLTAAFHSAQSAKHGIFSSLCRSQAAKKGECLIKGNIDKNTYDKFYHLPGCLHYGEVVIEKDIGEGYFCTEKEAVEAGFTKAAGC